MLQHGSLQIYIQLRRLLLCSILVFVTATAYAQDNFVLSDTDAAREFKAGNYLSAAKHFKLLADRLPNAHIVHRYYAISLDRLGQYDAAIEIFTTLLKNNSKNVATHYHLGVSLYKSRKTNTATEHFETVLELAEDSRYATLASEYIRAIAEQRSNIQQQGATRRFGLFAQLAFEQDNNIGLSPNRLNAFDDNDYAQRTRGLLALDYHFLRNSKWAGSFKASVSDSSYNDSQFNRFNVSQGTLGFSIQHSTRLGNTPFISKLAYEFKDVRTGNDRNAYSETHQVVLSGLFHLTNNQSASVYAQLREDDFSNEGFNPAVSSRDADRTEGGLIYTHLFANKKANVKWRIAYEENDAVGINFNRQAYKTEISLQFPTVWQVLLKLSAHYEDHEYADFLGPVIRETDISRYRIELSRWFGKHFVTRLSWSEHDEESSYENLSYERNIWGLDISYVF